MRKRGCVRSAGGGASTARQETCRAESKRKGDERNSRNFEDSFSCYLTPGSPICCCPGRNHSRTELWRDWIIPAQSYAGVLFCPRAVYASPSICSSACRASGNPNCLVPRSQGEDIVGRATRGGRWLRWWRWWAERKPGHISCGNGVITSPITIAITEGGLPGNQAYGHADGQAWGTNSEILCDPSVHSRFTLRFSIGASRSQLFGVVNFDWVHLSKWLTKTCRPERAADVESTLTKKESRRRQFEINRSLN